MFHDPTTLLRELRYLEAKHGTSADGPGFAFDRGRWGVRLVQLTHRLGDPRTARRMLVRALAEHPGPMVAEVTRELRRKARPPAPPRFSEPVDWLDRYRTA
jgi:hypothetical protein